MLCDNFNVGTLFQLIDLKAELLRKQEEFRRQKLENASGVTRATKTQTKVQKYNTIIIIRNFRLVLLSFIRQMNWFICG